MTSVLTSSATKYGVPYATAWEGTFTGLSKFQEDIKPTHGIEGFVIRFENGVRLRRLWLLTVAGDVQSEDALVL